MSELHIHIDRRVPKPEIRPTRLSAFILWCIAAAGLIAASFLSLLLAPALEGLNPHVQLLITNLAYYLPFAALPVFLLAKRRPGLSEAYRPNPISLFNTICTVVLALLGVFFVNDLVVVWSIPLQKLGFDVLSTSLPIAANTQELVLSVLYAAVLPAVCEEFLFRGAILPAFEGEGTKRAIWVSALLFMLIHSSIVGAPTQLILGMVLAYLVIWTNSIYAGLIYHTVHNASALLLQFIQDHTPAPADAPLVTDLLEAIGGMGGLGMLAVEILLTGGMMLITLKMFKLCGRLMGITDETGEKKPLRTCEWLVLGVGILLCLVLYGTDMLAMLGG